MSKAVAKREEAQPPAQVISSGDAMMGMLERAARDPNFDMAKFDKLMEHMERIKAQEKEAAYNAAMAAAQARLVPVVRNAKNTHTKSNYATIAAIHAAAMPVIREHGFGTSCGQFKSELPDHLGVLIDVMHAGGHSKQYRFDIPIDGAGMKGGTNKTATHAYGSTLQYGRRYGECMVFDIATKDDDDGNAAGGVGQAITEDQVKELQSLIVDVNASIPKFCVYMKVAKLEDIPASEFKRAVAALNSKRSAS